MFQYALITYGVNAGLPYWLELSHQVDEFRQQTDTSLPPCMRTIGSGELVRGITKLPPRTP